MSARDPEQWFRSLRADEKWTDDAQPRPHVDRPPAPRRAARRAASPRRVVVGFAFACALLALVVVSGLRMPHPPGTAVDFSFDPQAGSGQSASTSAGSYPQSLTATVVQRASAHSLDTLGYPSHELSSGPRPEPSPSRGAAVFSAGLFLTSAVWSADHSTIVVTALQPHCADAASAPSSTGTITARAEQTAPASVSLALTSVTATSSGGGDAARACTHRTAEVVTTHIQASLELAGQSAVAVQVDGETLAVREEDAR